MPSATASASASSGCGTSFAGLLTIAFVVLKLLHKIAWSWWWVVSPLWISAGIAVAVILLIACGAGAFFGVRALRRR